MKAARKVEVPRPEEPPTEPEEEEHHLSDEDHAVQKQIERVLKENRAGDIARAREGGVMDQEKQA